MKTIGIITARCGSKGIKDKNIKLLNGKPLIFYSINAALESNVLDYVVVSTDSQEYAEIAIKCGADVPFLRSEETSTDQAGSWAVVKEVIGKLEKGGNYFDRIMLLQPTSPLRTAEDIQNSIKLMEEKSALSIRSVSKMKHSPYWCNILKDDLSMDHFNNPIYAHIPRQDLEEFYYLNGAIYLISREELDSTAMFTKESYAYIMPEERSIDIDNEIDFMLAETLLKRIKPVK